jgi:DNA-binding transcriptional regulator YiaG
VQRLNRETGGAGSLNNVPENSKAIGIARKSENISGFAFLFSERRIKMTDWTRCIRELRKKFSLRALANELDITRRATYKIETGERIPNEQQAKRLLELLNGAPLGASSRLKSERSKPSEMTPERIRAILEKLRIPREDFAKLIGVAPRNLGKWLAGDSAPQGERLKRLLALEKLD